MAKGAYVGINNAAHKLKNIYVGVNNVPRKIAKGYVGVNGVPKQFWPPQSASNSWDYWTSVISTYNNPLITYIGNPLYPDVTKEVVYKKNTKIAYYGLFYLSHNYISYIFISPDSDAVETNKNTKYSTTVTDDNGITWYISGYHDFWSIMSGQLTPTLKDMIISKKLHSFESDYKEVLQQVAHELLDRIYAISFHEDYQVNQYYDKIPACGDIRRTIRKIVGYQLAYNVSKYGGTGQDEEGYKTYSDNIDTIIDAFMSDVHRYGNDNGMIIVSIQDYFWSGSPPLWLYHGHFKDGTCTSKVNYLEDVTITDELDPDNNNNNNNNQDGFPAKLLKFMWDDGWGYGPQEITYFQDWAFMERSFGVYCYADGTYETYGEEAGWGGQFSSDAFLGMYQGHTLITNLGIDL